MSMIITEVIHVLEKTQDGYRVIERWGDGPRERVDLFHQDLEETSAQRYIEVLACAMESGCMVIESLIATQEPEGGWRVVDTRGEVHGHFETVGYALLMMMSPLHRLAHQLPPLPKHWVPLFVYVRGPVIWLS